MSRLAVLVIGVLLWAAPGAAAPPKDPVGYARQLYNEGRWDEAIAAASDARRNPRFVDAATLVLARAHLERFRANADPADLEAGRLHLRAVKVDALSARDRLDLLVGLGESLYLEDQFGPAAELFESVLGRTAEVDPRAHDRLLEWYASAADRQAQLLPRSERPAAYRRLTQRLERELERQPSSAPAAYWLAAAARASGDLDRAWDAAVSAWVRAPLALDKALTLRTDVDRLVQQAIIPERVRLMGPAVRDSEQATASMRMTWEEIKEKWK
jgi:hypothetical protein